MKSVLISIQPKWCELIASGKKTVEVRKTKPKLETPFKVYIYETKDKKYENIGILGYKQDGTPYNFVNHIGKVIGEFVCDEIIIDEKGENSDILRFYGNLTHEELWEYGRNKTLYGWHISNLVIYEKPRELSEFYVEGDCACMNCKKCAWFDSGNGYNVEADCNLAYKGADLHKSFKPILRPPQSWCYVESEDTE
jgi:predicted transcriptional regulator